MPTETQETTTATTDTAGTEASQATEQAAGNPVSRDDLIKAVREAGGTESVDVEAEARAADGAGAGAEQQTQESSAATEEEPRIARILREREKAAQEREAARNLAEEMLARARSESDRLLDEARARAKAEAESELARLRAEFRANPSATLRALGDPKEISEAVMREGTPEAREVAQLRAQLEETKKQAAVADDVKKQFESFKDELRQQDIQRQLTEVKSSFLSHVTSEKTPYLSARYESDEIFQKADSVARQWRQGGLVLGKDFDFSDVAQYLELDSKKRLSSLAAPPAQQSSAGAPSKEPGNAPKSSANGPRTLSAAQGSERRTSPKPLREMTPSEARQALIEEVAATRRANPDAEW